MSVVPPLDTAGILGPEIGLPLRIEFPIIRSVNKIGIVLHRIFAITAAESRRGASTAGVFPFGLGWQTVGLAFFFAEPIAECLGVVPAYVHHGVIVRLGEGSVAPSKWLSRRKRPVSSSKPSPPLPSFSVFVLYPVSSTKDRNWRRVTSCLGVTLRSCHS